MRTCEVWRTSTTMASMNCTNSTQVCKKKKKKKVNKRHSCSLLQERQSSHRPPIYLHLPEFRNLTQIIWLWDTWLSDAATGRPAVTAVLWFSEVLREKTTMPRGTAYLHHRPLVPNEGVEAQPPHLHGELKDHHHQCKQLQGCMDLLGNKP